MEPTGTGLRGSLGDAARGIALMLRTQRNARIHAAAAAPVVAAGAVLGITASEWLAVVVAIAMVLTAEAFNTAIEWLGDAVTSESHPRVGQAKDVAAGAVLIATLGAAVIGLLVFGPYLLP